MNILGTPSVSWEYTLFRPLDGMSVSPSCFLSLIFSTIWSPDNSQVQEPMHIWRSRTSFQIATHAGSSEESVICSLPHTRAHRHPHLGSFSVIGWSTARIYHLPSESTAITNVCPGLLANCGVSGIQMCDLLMIGGTIVCCTPWEACVLATKELLRTHSADLVMWLFILY